MTTAAEPATAARQQARESSAAQDLEGLVRSDPAARGIRRRRCGRSTLASSGPGARSMRRKTARSASPRPARSTSTWPRASFCPSTRPRAPGTASRPSPGTRPARWCGATSIRVSSGITRTAAPSPRSSATSAATATSATGHQGPRRKRRPEAAHRPGAATHPFVKKTWPIRTSAWFHQAAQRTTARVARLCAAGRR